MKAYNSKINKNIRRKSALARLETQLARGSRIAGKDVPLTENDKKRIEKEIQTLKGRIF